MCVRYSGRPKESVTTQQTQSKEVEVIRHACLIYGVFKVVTRTLPIIERIITKNIKHKGYYQAPHTTSCTARKPENKPPCINTTTRTYHVGKYPTITGTNPRYNPRIPSSVHIRRKLAVIPLYNLPLGTPNPPRSTRSTCNVVICACKRVLTTSRGQVIRLVRIPAHAPATAFLEFGLRVCRIVLAGVDDGDGILAPEETETDGANVSAAVPFVIPKSNYRSQE